jgi:polyhydroxyalkanoate synthesis regulator phasin
MAEKAQTVDTKPASDGAPPAVVPPKRSPGHRGADVRDTVAEMAAKAQEISQEAGSKMAAAMKDVISAAAGLTGFAIESARDLVQYMVRRGQMTQEEADKLIREAEDADAKRKPHPVLPPSKQPKPPPVLRVEAVAPPPPPVPARPAPRAEPARAAAVSATSKKAAPAKTAKKKAPPRPASKGKGGAKASSKKKSTARR